MHAQNVLKKEIFTIKPQETCKQKGFDIEHANFLQKQITFTGFDGTWYSPGSD